MQQVDQLLFARWIISVDDQDSIYENHALAAANGKIVGIIPWQQAKTQFNAKEVIELTQHALFPGFINAHTHSPMVLLRGLADDLALMDWLNKHIWPTEQRFCNRDFIRDGMLLSAAEMIKSGTTCFNDHYFFPDVLHEVISQVGLRATIGLVLMSVPNDYANNEQAYLDKAEHTLKTTKAHPLIQFSYAPHAPYTCSNDLLLEVKRRQERDQRIIHMHVHESSPEIEGSLKEFGQRPLKRLHDLGLLGPRFLNVHMTQISDEDREILRASKSHVVHCPESNLKLASGYAPIQQFIDAGVNVAIGTDGAASNNDLDMIGEMRTAAFIGKTIAKDPTALSATTILQMATRNGARALGLQGVTGQLIAGYSADFIAVDMDHLNTQPCYNPIAQLVYAANNRQVSDVWVAGNRLLRNGQLTTIDEREILAIAKKWQHKIKDNLHVTQ